VFITEKDATRKSLIGALHTPERPWNSVLFFARSQPRDTRRSKQSCDAAGEKTAPRQPTQLAIHISH
jgi:hypothetical protein